VSDKIRRGVKGAAFENEPIYGTILPLPFADAVPGHTVAGTVFYNNCGGMNGALMVAPAAFSAAAACAVAAAVSHNDGGGVKSATVGTVPMTAFESVRAVAAAVSHKYGGGVKGARAPWPLPGRA